LANSPASRRNFIKAVGGSALATGIGANIIVPGRARAARKTLKILQWVHFVPAYDAWFNSERIKDWGEKNDTDVIVDNIHTAGISSRARAVDMSDVYQECERRVGKPIDLAIKSTYNPKTKKYFAFSPSFTPDPVNWRQDLFSQVGLSKGPTTWDEVRSFGSKIRQQSGTPVGIGLAQEEDTSMALRTIMYSWGAHEQDEAGNPVLNSKQTVDAIKFVKSLFEETMTPDVFTWDTSSNNRWMLAGKCSLAVNAISITREAENKGMTDISRKIQLARALKGPVRAIGLEHVMSCYVVWKFAENIAGAKQFLVDYTTDFKPAFLASQFYNFPCFPKTVPDLRQIIAYDDHAQPADKYKVLEDVLSWATNVGYPGHANAAIDEIFSTWLLNLMFAKAAGGALSPEEALKEADTACKRIFAKWKDRGLI